MVVFMGGLSHDAESPDVASPFVSSMHECHCSSSACASQNHLLHVGQRTVAGNPQSDFSGEIP